MNTQHSFNYGQHKVTMETGLIAKQATSAVHIRMGATELLVTLVAKPSQNSVGFLPLTVIYQERTYAFGKIPGGFLKREGRPSERETLISRLIDRSIRPLFDKRFEDEVQIIITLLSYDKAVEPDIPALLAVSAALGLAQLPITGMIAAARVGYDGTYHLNPECSHDSLKALNLVAAGTSRATVMIESGSKELSERCILNGIEFAKSHISEAIGQIETFVKQANVEGYGWQPVKLENKDLQEKITELALPHLEAIYLTDSSAECLNSQFQVETIKEQILSALEINSEHPDFKQAKGYFERLHKQIIRTSLIKHKKRLDGRTFQEVRSIESRVGLLSQAHGSALFTRGNTQAMVTVTLGYEKEGQLVEDRGQLNREHFLLHYNFPPFCVGETGLMFGPKRREIGHGHLAKRAIEALLPDQNSFPYTVRLVSEITEANGSSSMATICGSSLALMDAGVPMSEPIAGIAMGLIQEQGQTIVLSDINESEDHLGDMDLKVAGTSQGVTALQMDIKTLDGVNDALLKQALEQALEGRLYILSCMKQTLEKPRRDISPLAPQIKTVRIPKDAIRELIGKGGETIRSLCEQTNTDISVDDNGLVTINAQNKAEAEIAESHISEMTRTIKTGDIFEGAVTKMVDFGVFVNLRPGKDGLVHVSEISDEEIKSVTKEFVEGEMVKVKVLEVNKQGRIRLTMKDVEESSEIL